MEDHIQHARRFYNGAVRELNTRVQRFPTSSSPASPDSTKPSSSVPASRRGRRRGSRSCWEERPRPDGRPAPAGELDLTAYTGPQGARGTDYRVSVRAPGVAERQELEARHADEPPRTVEEFERLLPYAVALDAADTWAARFEDAIRAAEVDGTVQARSWYAAAASGGRGFSASTLGDSLASGIASSASAPGSSSGGGGGGSSGGGGGGGGW